MCAIPSLWFASLSFLLVVFNLLESWYFLHWLTQVSWDTKDVKNIKTLGKSCQTFSRSSYMLYHFTYIFLLKPDFFFLLLLYADDWTQSFWQGFNFPPYWTFQPFPLEFPLSLLNLPSRKNSAHPGLGKEAVQQTQSQQTAVTTPKSQRIAHVRKNVRAMVIQENESKSNTEIQKKFNKLTEDKNFLLSLLLSALGI